MRVSHVFFVGFIIFENGIKKKNFKNKKQQQEKLYGPFFFMDEVQLPQG